MKTFRQSSAPLLFALLAGCANLLHEPILPGEHEQTVIAKLGQPTHRHQVKDGYFLEYNRYPRGQETHIAHIDNNGKLISYEQVLTSQRFSSIKTDKTTKNEVLRIVGTPAETSYLGLSQLEVWSYPYKQDGVWDSIMHIHFDQAGVVKKMVVTSDRTRDSERHWGFDIFTRP